jgi:hypothetical protein
MQGKARSVFKVDVRLGEYVTAEDALAVWPQEVDHLRRIGRESKADKLQAKSERLQKLTLTDSSTVS